MDVNSVGFISGPVVPQVNTVQGNGMSQPQLSSQVGEVKEIILKAMGSKINRFAVISSALIQTGAHFYPREDGDYLYFNSIFIVNPLLPYSDLITGELLQAVLTYTRRADNFVNGERYNYKITTTCVLNGMSEGEASFTSDDELETQVSPFVPHEENFSITIDVTRYV